MRLASFVHERDGPPRLGALLEGDQRLVDLAHASAARGASADPAFASMQSLIDAGEEGLERAAALIKAPPASGLVDAAAVHLVAPLQPLALRCCSVFDGHHVGVARALNRRGTEGSAMPEEVSPLFRVIPAYYKANHLNVRGPGDLIEWPAFGDDLDFELELAAVIGRKGRDVPSARALDHVFGYTIYNDVSARVPQIAEMAMGLGPVKSKDFDGANVLGPVIVTRDELDPDDVLGIARVNGQELGRARSSEMRQGWKEIISYRSLGETMHPGEVITSGTFTGCSGIEHLRFLSPGDEVELEIEGIGVLRNKVGPRPAARLAWPQYAAMEAAEEA